MLLNKCISRNIINLVTKKCLRRCYSTTLKPDLGDYVQKPVMVNAVLKFLKPESEQVFVDMTFGVGGHTQAILDASENVNIIALDRDPSSHDIACQLSSEYPGRITPLLGTFSELPTLLHNLKISQNSIDGVLFDLGSSTIQLDTPSRGFTAVENGPLDMRMDQNRVTNQVTAKDILAKVNEDDLGRIFKTYGEEKQYKKIANGIAQFRHTYGSLETTQQLSTIINSLFEADDEKMHVNKVFQALRMFVNNELNEINYGLLVAQKYLKVGGRLVALSYNTLEDTIVKRHLTGNTFNTVANKMPLKYVSHSLVYDSSDFSSMMECYWQPLNQHVIVPSLIEVEDNPRSKTAMLRAAVKIK